MLRRRIGRLIFVAAVVLVAQMQGSVVTFDASGTFVDGSTLSGTLEIDTTAGVVTDANLMVGPQTLDFPFVPPGSFDVTFILQQGLGPSAVTYDVVVYTAGLELPYVSLALPTTSLIGYDGGEIGSLSQPAAGFTSDIQYLETNAYLNIGSLAPVPEPSTLLLMVISFGVLLIAYKVANRHGYTPEKLGARYSHAQKHGTKCGKPLGRPRVACEASQGLGSERRGAQHTRYRGHHEALKRYGPTCPCCPIAQ